MKQNWIAVALVLSVLILSAGCGMVNNKSTSADKKDNPERPQLISHVESLDNMLAETSGLIHFRGKLWTINDSGNEPLLFALDMETGRVLQGIRIENGKNKDWESLAQDDEHIYICDIGNNFGRRENLTIYKVAKNSIPASGYATVDAEIINYQYTGRTEKDNLLIKTVHDCEAAFVYEDSLYLFTKDRDTQTSTLYTCPTHPGSYEISARKTYDVDGLVTGADISPDSDFFILLGYKNRVPFAWIYKDFIPGDYSHGNGLRFEYPELSERQTEGIAVISPERVFISSEMTQYPPAIYLMDPGSILK